MMLFKPDGHLTDEALRAAVELALDEMSRLEVAEHLSFCDGCLERYTALLTDDTLLTPAQPIVAPMLSRLRKRAVALVFNRYTTYGAAACLALALWGTGVFTSLGSNAQRWENTKLSIAAQAAQAAAAVSRPSIMMQANDYFSGLARSMNAALDDMLSEAFALQKPRARADSRSQGTANQ